jgi:hypothetical protein
VITINNEYRQIFGSWHLNNPGNISSLEDEAMAFFAISVDRLEIEIDRRHKIAVDNHEILGWVDRLVRILKS